MRKNKKTKKRQFKKGDTIYFTTVDGIESAIVNDIDGNELILQDYSIMLKKDCLDENDPRVIEYKSQINIS